MVGRDCEYQLSLYLVSAVTHTAKGREWKGYPCCFFLKEKQKARVGEMKILLSKEQEEREI